MIFQSEYDELLGICRQITSHKQTLAKPRIEEMVLKHLGPEVPNAKLLWHLIAESLLKRIDRQLLESKNIFVQAFDVPQTKLFYSMAEAVPFVYMGHSLANQYLVKVTENLKGFTVFDIGIGNGKQMVRLLQSLAEKNGNLESVSIFGLDPVEQNIVDAGQAIEDIKQDLPFKVDFVPLCMLIENLTDSDFERIKNVGGDSIVVNSAFTLHHSAHPLNDQKIRTDLLRKLSDLKPRVLTMVEPNSNHDTEDLTKRFHNCWQHFGNVFALVDEANIEDSHKFLIKEKFFGREIRNIFGVSDFFRSERHELYDSWLLKLHMAGYKPFPFHALDVKMPEYCQFSITEGLVRLDYNQITIVAVMAFQTI